VQPTSSAPLGTGQVVQHSQHVQHSFATNHPLIVRVELPTPSPRSPTRLRLHSSRRSSSLYFFRPTTTRPAMSSRTLAVLTLALTFLNPVRGLSSWYTPPGGPPTGSTAGDKVRGVNLGGWFILVRPRLQHHSHPYAKALRLGRRDDSATSRDDERGLTRCRRTG
jgi:hypothetical protein